MNKQTFVATVLNKTSYQNIKISASAYAPSNIALCKYWGKRDILLNLPVNSSLSIALGNKGAQATLTLSDKNHDLISVNQQSLAPTDEHAKRLSEFLDLFRPNMEIHYALQLTVNLPLAAGLASSACIFASIVLALNELWQWQLSTEQLSLLARLGSGSAARSVYPGFAVWHRGEKEDGLDSFAEAIDKPWDELCIGLCLFSREPKAVSSRIGMQRTKESSILYQAWPEQAKKDYQQLLSAIKQQDFALLGKTAETNALAMHATMLAAWPPLMYATPLTIQTIQQIWLLRRNGLALYFTQDAGPNLKLLFLAKDMAVVKEHFPDMEIIQPFKDYPQ